MCPPDLLALARRMRQRGDVSDIGALAHRVLDLRRHPDLSLVWPQRENSALSDVSG